MLESLLYGSLFLAAWLFLFWIGRKFVLWYFRVDEVVSLLSQIRDELVAGRKHDQPRSRGLATTDEGGTVEASTLSQSSAASPPIQSSSSLGEPECIEIIRELGSEVRTGSNGGWEVRSSGSSIVSFATTVEELRQIQQQLSRMKAP
jgi:hypothetical protein